GHAVREIQGETAGKAGNGCAEPGPDARTAAVWSRPRPKHRVTILRAFLACAWLLFSVTATVSLPSVAADMPENMPCHENRQAMPHDKKRPDAPQTVMPCCSQPILAATAEPAPFLSRSYEPVRLTPAAAAPLRNLPACLEPRPPKII